MTIVLALVLVTLGTYRISRMLVSEDGPMDAFTRLRNWAGQRTSLGRGMHCYFCVSFWIAGLAAVLLALQGATSWWDVWLTWPGIAGAAVGVYQVVR